MKVDVLFAEIGSTTTVVSAFELGESPHMIGQGEHWTTVREGNVIIGIERAIHSLKSKLKITDLTWDKFYATSSAAGGLKMTVHGLVYDMTVRAAKEAALGAGAILSYTTAGKLGDHEIEKVKSISPKLIILAGGVDFGDSDTVVHNAGKLAASDIDVPIIYAGNTAAKDEVQEILASAGKNVIITENVYPSIDYLNVDPARKAIQEVFSRNIVKAPGMERIYDMVDYRVIPTPAAVMLATELMYSLYGDTVTVDIGGATTDIDSVTDGSPEIQEIAVSPQPHSKRTVEGDLGVFINSSNVIDQIRPDNLRKEFVNLDEIIANISPYPKNDTEEKFMARLGSYCFETSLMRHVGKLKYIFTPLGRKKTASGKDLTAIKNLLGTGGILTRSRYNLEILKSIEKLTRNNPTSLLPLKKPNYYIDSNYIFACIGLLSLIERNSALELLKSDIKLVQ